MEFETQRGAEDKFPFFPTSAGKNISIWSKKQRRKGILYAGKFKHYYLMVCSVRSHQCSTFSLAIKYVHLNEKESWTSSFWGSRHFPYHGFPRYDRNDRWVGTSLWSHLCWRHCLQFCSLAYEGRRPRWITPSSICLIIHILREPNSLIALLFIQSNSFFKNIAKTCLPASMLSSSSIVYV